MSEDERIQLRLLDALIQWTDPALVDQVRAEERKLIAYELNGFSRPKITPRNEWTQPTSRRWIGGHDTEFLLAAWHRLEEDFARRIEGEELFLEGVRSSPDQEARPEPIPPAWAAELTFG